MYSRHVLPPHPAGASAGQDLFPPERDDSIADSGARGGAMESHESMLERQRALAQARSAARLSSAPSFTSADPTMAGKTSISRGAPMMTSSFGGSFSGGAPTQAWGSGPVDRTSGLVSATGLGTGSSLSAAISSPAAAPKSSTSLTDALKEREKRSKDVLGPSDPPVLSPTGFHGPAATGAGSMPVAATATRDTLMPIAPLLMSPSTLTRAEHPAVAATTALDLSDLRRFLTTPTPRSAGTVQCYIERDRSGLTGRLYPTYSLYLKEGNRFLMAARKRSKNKTSNYLMSTDKRDLNRASASFVGKLRSNFVGTEFHIFDDGEAPEKVKGSEAPVRQELGIVTYASNVLGSRGPRKMQVAVPKVSPDGRRIVFQPEKEDDSMAALFKAGHTSDMVLMANKPPKWNDQIGAYVLNFNGRVTMASVKNFQLASPDDPETVLLQFGRTEKDEFTLDYQWPLCPVQAFAVALSSFDYKLACE